jgi:hypothetical protein
MKIEASLLNYIPRNLFGEAEAGPGFLSSLINRYANGKRSAAG